MKLHYAVIQPTRELKDGNNVELIFKEVEGESSLEILQKEVGGYIEHLTWCFPWAEEVGIDAWGNDEATIYGLPVSCLVVNGKYPTGHPRQFVTWLRGNIVFTRFTEDGDTISLTEQDKELIKDKFWWGIDFNTTNPDDPDGDFLRPFVQDI